MPNWNDCDYVHSRLVPLKEIPFFSARPTPPLLKDTPRAVLTVSMYVRCPVTKDHKRLQSRSNISKSPSNHTPFPHYTSSGLVTWYFSNDSIIALYKLTTHPVVVSRF